jgi:molybdopterin-guanine dinucleotide biosynthesis adapter protein
MIGAIRRNLAESIARRASLSGTKVSARRLDGRARRSVGTVRGLPVIIQVVGDSGSGKTLVVELAVRRLVARHLTVAVVKHSHHSPDLRGKDSARFAAAGASAVLLASRRSFVSFASSPLPWIRILPADIVLVEGYSRQRFGGPRFRIRSPREAGRLVEAIVALAPPRSRAPKLRVDGRVRPTKGPWRLVANLLESQGTREVRREQ